MSGLEETTALMPAVAASPKKLVFEYKAGPHAGLRVIVGDVDLVCGHYKWATLPALIPNFKHRGYAASFGLVEVAPRYVRYREVVEERDDQD